MASSPIIIVGGALANKPMQGGEAWVRLSWLLGFRQLGFRVHFIERIEPSACTDAAVNYFDGVVRQFELQDQATLVRTDDTKIDPLLIDLVAQSQALINISGHLTLAPLLGAARRRVFIDIDPGFTQFWHAAGNAAANLAGHTHYYTIGENIGSPDCAIPTGGIAWRAV